ncbi:hypothetical protein KU43P_27920 [Pseudomonas sp. KU43P]|nr:hypothetical protein KU43P_27920 [Pseudomonas sp. KU43P]
MPALSPASRLPQLQCWLNNGWAFVGAGSPAMKATQANPHNGGHMTNMFPAPWAGTPGFSSIDFAFDGIKNKEKRNAHPRRSLRYPHLEPDHPDQLLHPARP